MIVEGSHERVLLKLGYITHHVLSRKWRELRMRSTLSQLRLSSFFAELKLSNCASRLDIGGGSDELLEGDIGLSPGRLHRR